MIGWLIGNTLFSKQDMSRFSMVWTITESESSPTPNLCVSEQQRLVSTGPRSAVGNVSGYRCKADCRSRGREFDPGPVPYFRGD